MNILGVSFDYHESAAALLVDGEIISAAAEERFSRKKNDSSLPIKSIQFCCEHANISPSKIDHVVFYECTPLKLSRIIKSELKLGNFSGIKSAIDYWIENEKFFPKKRLADALNIPFSRIKSIKHHQAHAGSAFYGSPFHEATVVTLDGVGELETLTVSKADKTGIKQLYSCQLPDSLGLFYSAITAFLGFKVNEEEYKVMGMSGFGDPTYYEKLKNLFLLHDDGTFSLDRSYFDFSPSAQTSYTHKLIELIGDPRIPETPFFLDKQTAIEKKNNIRFADIASSAQKITEEVIFHVVKVATKRVGYPDVCLAGGVALNSLANGKLKQNLKGELYVQPASGDSGGSLGAAYYYYHSVLGHKNRMPMTNAYLGKSYNDQDIKVAINKSYTKCFEHIPCSTDLVKKVSSLLKNGAVVGWFQGRSEFGPRALGSRSILANPLLPDMQNRVNKKIKFREPFRPFAPAICEESAGDIFELPSSTLGKYSPEPYMRAICKVKPKFQSILPSITHVDGTARVQLVSKNENQLFYSLLKHFSIEAGYPILLNTSFNLRGEPIVETPLNAIRTFEWSGMDYLVIGNYIITKE